MTAIYWLTAAASLTGVWLNIGRHRACFAIWFFTNITWAVADVTHDLIPQAVVQLVYAGLSVYGWRAWLQPTSVPETTS